MEVKIGMYDEDFYLNTTCIRKRFRACNPGIDFMVFNFYCSFTQFVCRYVIAEDFSNFTFSAKKEPILQLLEAGEIHAIANTREYSRPSEFQGILASGQVYLFRDVILIKKQPKQLNPLDYTWLFQPYTLVCLSFCILFLALLQILVVPIPKNGQKISIANRLFKNCFCYLSCILNQGFPDSNRHRREMVIAITFSLISFHSIYATVQAGFVLSRTIAKNPLAFHDYSTLQSELMSGQWTLVFPNDTYFQDTLEFYETNVQNLTKLGNPPILTNNLEESVVSILQGEKRFTDVWFSDYYYLQETLPHESFDAIQPVYFNNRQILEPYNGPRFLFCSKCRDLQQEFSKALTMHHSFCERTVDRYMKIRKYFYTSEPVPLRLDDVRPLLLLWFIGCVISIVAYFIENLYCLFTGNIAGKVRSYGLIMFKYKKGDGYR